MIQTKKCAPSRLSWLLLFATGNEAGQQAKSTETFTEPNMRPIGDVRRKVDAACSKQCFDRGAAVLVLDGWEVVL